MNLHTEVDKCCDRAILSQESVDYTADRNWYAVFTLPQSEKSALKHLDIRALESFLPTYEAVRIWKNRQRVKVILPLFPGYLFVHINSRERTRVLEAPGVIQIVGGCREYSSIPDYEIETLRSGCFRQRVEPFRELVVGRKVRIKSGPMQGATGILAKKGRSMRFVLTLELINQHAQIHVDAEDLEPITG